MSEKIEKIELADEQKANLIKLATYLEGLPADYKHFEMADFFSSDLSDDPRWDEIFNYVTGGVALTSCGTVACAVGHGPAAGVPVRASELMNLSNGRIYPNWDKYSDRFMIDRDGFAWLFGSDWSAHDNHHHGAAARIRYLLEHGGPPSNFDREEGYLFGEFVEAYASFRKA